MTNDKANSHAPRLAGVKDAVDTQYIRVAKNYFSPKGKGITLSTAKKCFLWIALIMSGGIMLPQLFSERMRQEVAEEINPQQNSEDGKEFKFPSIQNSGGNEDKRSNGDKKQNVPPIQRIKSIDLRTLTDPPPGSEVMGILVSGGSNGTVKVRLTEDLGLNGDLYAAKNSLLIGQGSSSDQRLFINFTRMVSPEGKSKKVGAQAYDFKDKIRGLNGKRVSDQVFKIAASSALIFLGGVADSLQEGTTGALGNQRKSLHDAALSGVAQATTEHGRRYLDSLDHDNRIEVKNQTELIVIFENGDDKK